MGCYRRSVRGVLPVVGMSTCVRIERRGTSRAFEPMIEQEGVEVINTKAEITVDLLRELLTMAGYCGPVTITYSLCAGEVTLEVGGHKFTRANTHDSSGNITHGLIWCLLDARPIWEAEQDK